MKNIHVLPTDKPSRLVRNHINKLLLTMQHLPLDKEIYCFPQNIYITSDEEIKEGDYRYNTLHPNEGVFKVENKEDLDYVLRRKQYKKIILTDNKDLIKDGVQAIDDEFLEWFVNNPSCEEVEVKNPLIANVSDFGYKIIIPKEEPKQEYQSKCICDTECRGFVNVKCKKPKQETLEEFANKTYPFYGDVELREAIELGAKWQAERSYSEEKVKPLLDAIKYFIDRVENGTIRSKTTYNMYKEVLSQFKNK